MFEEVRRHCVYVRAHTAHTNDLVCVCAWRRRQAYDAIMSYVVRSGWYLSVDMNTSNMILPYFDALSAFWPGLQVRLRAYLIRTQPTQLDADDVPPGTNRSDDSVRCCLAMCPGPWTASSVS
jgi:hypothetical protein